MTLSGGQLLSAALSLLICYAAAADQSGLRAEPVTCVTEGEPIFWREFERGEPSEAVIFARDPEGPGMYGEHPPEAFWGVRHPGWTAALLNAHGQPPDLTLDPGRTETCDIYLGLRAVDPIMTFGIRLASEDEFATITAPAATHTRHYDLEFFWKAQVPMANEEIVVRALGKPVYLQYLRFVPHVQATGQLRVAEQRVVIVQEPGRHFAFPGIAELPSGDLVVVCREGDAHVCPRGRVVLSRSTDGGRTWSPRQVLYDSPSDERDPAAIVLEDGSLVVSFCTWDSWRAQPALRTRYPDETAHMETVGWGKYSGAWVMVSSDEGKTWCPPRRSPVFSPHGPVQGPDAALYWVGLESRDGANVVAIWRSADLGEHWTRFSEVSYSPGLSIASSAEVWDEPNIIFLPGGKAICTLRVEMDGFVRHAVSRDGGKTWGWPHRLPVWGFPQHLCQLSDGRLLMSYGYRREPLGVRACLSADGGETWDLGEEIALRHEGGNADLGYPYSIELRAGRVFTVYYYNHAGGDCYIEGAFYRP